MVFDNSHITALTDLINKAVQDVIAEYAAVGQAVPSLDTLDPGPFNVPEDTPVRLAKAIQIIEAACAQLSYTVAPPGSVIVNKSLEHEEPACMLVVTEARIADLLLNKPQAARSGLDAGKLTRILRLLATRHCFKEVKPGVFANNRLSMKLLSSDPVSSIVCLLTDESLRASAYLNDTLRDPSEMDGGIPFRRATGYSFFDFHKSRFPRAMVGWGNVTGKGFLAKVYPWASQPADSTICDIAGGNGHVTMGLIKVHPHIKVVLQDQPQVIEMAKKFWETEHPGAIKKQRVQFAPFDFFKDVAVKGCDFYYTCICVTDDTVLRDAVRTHGQASNGVDVEFDIAPEPLLPNYGLARVRTYELDMTMMNLLNAQARTLPEFIELCKNCGLKFEKLYEAGETDLVEFSPI
ncbi:S-adenosyl-L-methionine-dependent methyltransferase [Gymnopus androsaceus JB14]|uniref:S-adenosyl-L-methionine-dependent methyltransferase n=1 Tax=Gymnopus androsaceus JB14 TaxID=1447944 RepID=A0A6A4I3Y0_9AGAR|nr:S-adenosyl-L-methionine-dependent methyltransferase [Gymnopus androsaceus JB14]